MKDLSCRGLLLTAGDRRRGMACARKYSLIFMILMGLSCTDQAQKPPADGGVEVHCLSKGTDRIFAGLRQYEAGAKPHAAPSPPAPCGVGAGRAALVHIRFQMPGLNFSDGRVGGYRGGGGLNLAGFSAAGGDYRAGAPLLSSRYSTLNGFGLEAPVKTSLLDLHLTMKDLIAGSFIPRAGKDFSGPQVGLSPMKGAGLGVPSVDGHAARGGSSGVSLQLKF